MSLLSNQRGKPRECIKEIFFDKTTSHIVLWSVCSNSIRWAITCRSSLDVQPKEELEIDLFGSPLDSPSKFASGQIVSMDSIVSEDSERTRNNQDVASISAELPHIQLTSHADLYTPVQSDSTNRVIFSSNVLPSATISESSFSIQDINQMEHTRRPTSSLVFSPPLTRSAARRWVGLKCFSCGSLLVLFRSQKEVPINDTKTAPVALFHPQLTPAGDFGRKSTKQRKLKTQTSTIGIRRSARLLKGKK